MDYTALRATLTDYYMHKVAGSVEDLRVKVYEMHSDINIRASSISFSVSLFLLSLMAFFSLFLFLELFLPFTRFGIQTRISDYAAEDVCFFADCINGLPRKILGYKTPEELFDCYLDRIYAA